MRFQVLGWVLRGSFKFLVYLFHVSIFSPFNLYLLFTSSL